MTQSRPPLSKSSKGKHAFREKVESANQTAICAATCERVGRRTLRELLRANAYSIPIFQRRYCWTTDQWGTLWNDARKRTALRHSLGRLTCTAVRSEQQRSMIIDGQQRMTTVTLILAATRDELVNNLGVQRDDPLVASIHRMLFLDVEAMQEWVVQTSDAADALREGTVLEFCRLIPSYCDRSAYLASILPPWSRQAQTFRETHYNPKWHRPFLAKAYFSQKLQSLIHESSSSLSPNNAQSIIERFSRNLLDGIDMLYFPIATLDQSNDGTTDTQVIYERLAIRDATWCKPRRVSEYHVMDGSDMIRNLFLGSFSNTHEQTDFYETYWLPLERLHPRTDDTTSCKEEESLKDVLSEFLMHEVSKLDEKQNTLIPTAISTAVIGGSLYRDFEAWMTYDYHHLSTTTKATPEAHTRDVGRKLLEFARCD
mmetsp:Transcript_40881/g.85731  ORF Transcript_40881/g.85731 Transcript_40881/m.85731 type:complete len:428 (+) Transcript_40881:296-1579(+)